MSIVRWGSSLAIGIDAIDAQHKQLVDIINRLHGLILERNDATLTKDMVSELSAYAVYHFSEEEAFMTSVQYDDIAAQQAAHLFYIDKVNEFSERIGRGEQHVLQEACEFLLDWLLEHIMVMDKALAAFVVRDEGDRRP